MTETPTMRRQRSRHQNLAMMAVALAIAVAGSDVSARPTSQAAAFTYQGVLKQSGSPINGSVDLQFKLFDAPNAGTQIGSTLAANAVALTNGVFASSLDFGSLAFNGEERWLEIAVDDTPGGGAGPFITLAPRQRVASAPYAAYALNAALAGTYANAVNLSNAANAFVGNGAGLTSLNASNIASGTIANARTTGTSSNTANTLVLRDGSGGVTFGAVAATSFTGSGAGLTNLNADNITAGTLSESRLPASLLGRIPSESIEPILCDFGTVDGFDLTDVVRFGDYAYASESDGSHLLWTFRVSDPDHVVTLDTDLVIESAYALARSGSTLVVLTDSQVQAFDLTNPANPAFLNAVSHGAIGARAVAVSGSLGAAATTAALKIFSVSAGGVTSLGQVLNNGVLKVAVAGNFVYAATSTSLTIYNCTNPSSPTLAGSVSLGASPTGIAVSGTTAFVIESNNTLQAFNVANPFVPSLVGTVPVTPAPRDIEVVGTRAHVLCSGAYQIFDVANPAAMASLVNSQAANGTALAVSGSSACIAYLNQVAMVRLDNLALGRTMVASAFVGSGLNLTSLNASAMNSGTIASSVLSGTYSGALNFSNGSNTIAGNGAALTNLNAGNVTSGNLSSSRLPTGGPWSLTSNLNIDAGTLVVDQASNRVGVGTAAPEAALHIFDGSAGTVTANGNAALVVESSTSGWINILTPDGTQRGILFGDPTDPESGGILYDTANNNGFQFRTNGNVTRMTLDAGGLLGIGMVPTTNRLEVNGNASKSTAGSWLANSDRRIKTDVETVTNALDTLDRVRLVSFRYTPEYLKAHSTIEDRRYLNVIAQEFAKVFPEHVKGSGEHLPTGEEILQVDTYPLTIYSAAAVQELHQRISIQDDEIAALRSDVARLESLVQRMLASGGAR